MTIKHPLFVGAAVAGIVALAATVASPVQAQDYNWSGVYAGAHVGYGWSDVAARDVLPPNGGFFTPLGPAAGQGFTFDLDGVIGGAQVGIQHQWGNIVLGAEISTSSGKLSKTSASPYFTSDIETGKINSLFLATARLGYAHNNWLIYVKGGYASADVEFQAYDRVANSGYGQTKRQDGFAIGGGIEYGLTKNITLGLEYMKIDFGSETGNGLRSNGSPEMYKTDAEMQTVTARINFLIGREPDRAAPLK